MDVQQRAAELVKNIVTAMGLALDVQVHEHADGIRLDISGEGGEVLLKRKGETLDAMQLIVNTAFRRDMPDDRSFIVDCMGYRLGKDAELKQMARFLMEKVKSSGAPQEIGPLNPYSRRLVHLTVAEDPTLASESIGDAFLKTVIISARR